MATGRLRYGISSANQGASTRPGRAVCGRASTHLEPCEDACCIGAEAVPAHGHADERDTLQGLATQQAVGLQGAGQDAPFFHHLSCYSVRARPSCEPLPCPRHSR